MSKNIIHTNSIVLFTHSQSTFVYYLLYFSAKFHRNIGRPHKNLAFFFAATWFDWKFETVVPGLVEGLLPSCATDSPLVLVLQPPLTWRNRRWPRYRLTESRRSRVVLPSWLGLVDTPLTPWRRSFASPLVTSPHYMTYHPASLAAWINRAHPARKIRRLREGGWVELG
jgi:hypothetical protein